MAPGSVWVNVVFWTASMEAPHDEEILMAIMFIDKDADLSYLDGKVIGIFGYGNQGRSQALNLRDSGLQVIVGSRRDPSYDQAVHDGFTTLAIADAAERADILLLLIPDEIMPQVYQEDIAAQLQAGDMLVFASGYNITFGFLQPPDHVDVAMLAPRMIGHGVREMFLNGEGFPSLIAVEQDASGVALQRTLALSKGIGSTKMGVILSSFEEETTVDLFSEHISELYAIRRFFEVLVEAGCSPEVVLLELYASGERISTSRAYRDMGLWEQITTHSRTSQYGQEVIGKLSPQEEAQEKERLGSIIENIRNGSFARQWQQEQRSGSQTLKRVREENLDHPLVQAERDLYRKLGRIK